MAMWYVYSNDGNRVGPLTDQAFRKLIQQGKIQRNTIVANQFGRTVTAGSIPGLPFPDQAGEFSQINSGAAPSSYGQVPNAVPNAGRANPFGQDPYVQGAAQEQGNPFQERPVPDDNPFAPPEEPPTAKRGGKAWVVVTSVVVCVLAALGWLVSWGMSGKVTIDGKTYKQPAPIHGIRFGDKLGKYRRGKWKTDYSCESSDDDVLILRPNGEKGLIIIGADEQSLRVTSVTIYYGSLLIDEEREKFENEKRYVEENYHYVKLIHGEYNQDYYLYQTSSNGCTIYASVDFVSSEPVGPKGVHYSLEPPKGM